MNDTPKLVATTTLTTADWANSTLLTGTLADALAEHRQRPGKDIRVIGSPTLVRSLLREHLLDELELLVHPIVLGSGKRLFEDARARVPRTLVAPVSFTPGVLTAPSAPPPGCPGAGRRAPAAGSGGAGPLVFGAGGGDPPSPGGPAGGGAALLPLPC